MSTLTPASISMLQQANPLLVSNANILDVLQLSSTFVDMLNTFSAGQGNIFQFGPADGGSATIPNQQGGKTITLDSNILTGLTQNPDSPLAAGMLVVDGGHELGHATQTGGNIDFTTAATPGQAASIADGDEGVAAVPEYSIVKQLNANGIGVQMAEGAGLTKVLDQIAQTDSDNGMFNQDATLEAAAYIGENVSPSVAPNLTYTQFAEDFFALSYTGALSSATKSPINLQTVLPGDVTISENGSSWTVNGSIIAPIGASQTQGQLNITGSFTNSGLNSSGISGSAQIVSINNAGQSVGMINLNITNGNFGSPSLSGTNIFFNGSNLPVTLENGTTAEVDGANNTFSVGSNDVLSASSTSTINIFGTGNVVGGDGASQESINFGQNATGFVTGGNALVSLGQGASAGIFGASGVPGYVVNSTDASMTLATGASVFYAGNNSSLNLQAGTSVGIIGGGGLTMAATGATIDTNGGVGISQLSGGDDQLNLGQGQSGSFLGIISGSGYNVASTGSTIDVDANIGLSLTGSNNHTALGLSDSVVVGGLANSFTGTSDNFTLNPDAQISLLNGTNYNFTTSDDNSINLFSSMDASFAGSGSSQIAVNDGSTQLDLGPLIDGGQYTVSLGTEFDSIRDVIIHANDAVIDGQVSEAFTVVGNDDMVEGGYFDQIHIDGSGDQIFAPRSDIGFAAGSEDDEISSDDDSEGDWTGGYGSYSSGGYSGGGDGGGYYGYGYGFAANKGPKGVDVGSIAAADALKNEVPAAIGMEAARLQAESATANTSPAGLSAAQFEGGKWSGKTITWSVNVQTGSGSSFSGAISGGQQSLISQAFDQWAKASGLNFVEVSGGGQADIKLGWSPLDSSVTGVLGYTSYKAEGGVLQNASILLEDPSEDALVQDSTGQLAYAGTGTELEQVVLHEIGHALGLADSSDPNSIMAATLSNANLTLDSTDVAAVQALYGASGSSSLASSTGIWSAYNADSSQLIEAIAGFGGSGGEVSAATLLPPPSFAPLSQQLAAAH